MIAPRALRWTGTQPAAALWLDRGLLGEAEARSRILSLWTPGATVRDLAGGYLVLLATPLRVDAQRAPGLPLVRVRGRLLSAPLTPAEWDAVAPPPGALLLVRGGRITLHQPDAAPAVQPQAWLDLRPLAATEVVPLGDPPPPPEAVSGAASLASQLGILPDDEAAALLSALSAEGSSSPSGSGWSLAGALGGTFRAWKGAADNMSDSFGGLKSVAQRSFGWLDKLAARSGLLGQLEKLLDKKGAARIRSLLDQFERGDTDDALRGAIPLRKNGTSPGLDALSKALSGLLARPARGGGLSAPAGGSGGKSLSVADELYALLEQMYRSLHTQLDEAGRVQEAAYVLSDLLDEPEEAIAYLLERGEHVLAAELAERHGRPIGQQIALWLRAGDRSRALLLARLRDGFEPAIKELEANDPALARWLRTRWATFLASTGRYIAAVEVAWPLGGTPSATAQGWLDKAIALGGPGSARALRMKLERCPGALDELRAQLRPMLRDASAEGRLVRHALATELAEVPAARGLARPLARAVMRDEITHGSPAGKKALGALCAVVDPALGVDLPPSKPAPARPLLSTLTADVLTHTVPGGDTGLHAVYDVALLPGGGTLAALGRAGCHLFDSSGRRIGVLDAPITELVMTPDGSRALGLAPREGLLEVYQLDLAARTAMLGGTLRCHDALRPERGLLVAHHAEQYDGHTFVVSSPDTLAILSVYPGEPIKVLWQLALPESAQMTLGPVTWSPKSIDQLVLDPTGLEWWSYPLPGPRPRERKPLRGTPRPGGPGRHKWFGDCAGRIDRGGLHLHRQYTEETFPLDVLAEVLGPPPYRLLHGSRSWLALAAGERAHLWVANVPRTSGRRLTVTLTDTGRIKARVTSTHAIFFDELGRILAFDLKDGALSRSIRA